MINRYTTPYTVADINAIINSYDNSSDTGVYVLFSNIDYAAPRNGNVLSTESFWRQLSFSNVRIFTFFLVTCSTKDGVFKWNAILNMYYEGTSPTFANGNGTFTVRNYSSSDTYDDQVVTTHIKNVTRSQTWSPELFSDNLELYQLKDRNYVYYFKLDGTITYGLLKTNEGKPDIYQTFVNELFGTDSDVTLTSTDKMSYKLLFTYNKVTSIDPIAVGNKSFVAVYTNRCGVNAPQSTDWYVDGLKASLARMQQLSSVSFIDLNVQNSTLNWRSRVIVVTYMVSCKIFTIAYSLKFDSDTSGTITSITALKYNGIELTTVFQAILDSRFSVTYSDGLLQAEPGESVTSSKLALDISIVYDEDSLYSLEYIDMWYNHVDGARDAKILCIGLCN